MVPFPCNYPQVPINNNCGASDCDCVFDGVSITCRWWDDGWCRALLESDYGMIPTATCINIIRFASVGIREDLNLKDHQTKSNTYNETNSVASSTQIRFNQGLWMATNLRWNASARTDSLMIGKKVLANCDGCGKGMRHLTENISFQFVDNLPYFG